MARVRGLFSTLVFASLFAGLVPAAHSQDDAEATAPAPPMTTFPYLGGTVTMNPNLETGERFLQPLSPPVFTRTEEALQNPRLEPGNQGDTGNPLIALKRPVTDYSFMYENWTGGMRINNVHGTPDAFVCICDITLIMTNESGMDPTRPLITWDSSHLWFDNVTMYGGALSVRNTDHVIVTNSLFIDSSGVVGDHSAHGYLHNIPSTASRRS